MDNEVWEANFEDALTYEKEPDNVSDRYTIIIAQIGKSIPEVGVTSRVKCSIDK